MQRNLVIYPTAASSSIEITEIDLGSALFACNNVFIALLNYMQYKLVTRYRWHQGILYTNSNYTISRKCYIFPSENLCYNDVLIIISRYKSL